MLSIHKTFQEKLIQILFDVEASEKVWEVGFKNCVDYIFNIIYTFMSGDVPIKELIVSKILRKPLSEYTRMFPPSLFPSFTHTQKS